MTNNSLSEDIYAVGQLMADNLNAVGVSDADVDDGLTTLANKILNASGGKTQTILTLNTPMVVYTDLFTVTGTLTDSEENPISGATIQLIWNDGSEHIATGTTNSSGVFSFTSTDPASVSQYSFQLFFAGDNDYNASNSSVVNVNTSKETSILVVTSPASGTVVSTDSVTVTGTVKDNDGTPLTGEKVYFLLNNSSHAGYTTIGSNGSFTKTVTRLSAGSNSITVSFAGITTHTAANQSIIVNRATFDGLADLELIDGSQILSYADEQSTPNSQYATLETQLMNGESAAAIEGVSVGFYDYSDENNPVLLGSDDTNSSGTASFIYFSRGVGDVPIKAKVGTIVSESYTIEDCSRYDSLTYSSLSMKNWILPSSDYQISFIINSNDNTSDNTAYLKFENTSKFIGKAGSSSREIIVYDGSNHSLNQIPVSIDTEYTAKWINNVCTFSSGNDSITFNMIAPTLLGNISATTNGTIKNIKIKPLHSHDDGEYSSGGADIQLKN